MTYDDLPLFSNSTASDKLALEWQKCKAKHPGLLLQLAGLARELKTAGHSRYSMDGLFLSCAGRPGPVRATWA